VSTVAASSSDRPQATIHHPPATIRNPQSTSNQQAIRKQSASNPQTIRKQQATMDVGKGNKANPKSTTSHWLDSSDAVVFQYNEERLSLFQFKVRGNPRPLIRHRTKARGVVYNPSSVLQKSFRHQVLQIIASVDRNLTAPLFQEKDCLVMTVVLRMQRPKSHFVGSQRGSDRLKASAPRLIADSRTDVDNMAKFVMDSMNKVLYPDDRQIASLRVTKVLDDDGLCEGSTEICIRAIGKHDLDVLTKCT
jgi:Holliday junction resolvase RusA-like endonuclease